MRRLTYLQAERRANRAWLWLMKTEPKFGSGENNPRWETFRRIRDRLRPFRLPLSFRIELDLVQMVKGKVEDQTLILMDYGLSLK